MSLSTNQQPEDLHRKDPNGSKSKTQFVELNETIPVGVASDGALVDPEDDEALYVEDHEILLDCSDIIRVIIEDTRSYGVPIRYKTSASYRESHNG